MRILIAVLMGFMIFIMTDKTGRKGVFYSEEKTIEINELIIKRLLVDFAQWFLHGSFFLGRMPIVRPLAQGLINKLTGFFICKKDFI